MPDRRTQEFVVLDDDETFSGLDKCTILLVEGEFDSGESDKAIKHLIQRYDQGLRTAKEAEQAMAIMQAAVNGGRLPGSSLNCLTPILVPYGEGQTPLHVKAITVSYLLAFFLKHYRPMGVV